ncbi:hypothetical protein J2T12_000854 [Paenibacillus anaericanus]|uniref:hypothetical protein n=1 Tax=Paenibacillus anaericanus TaxID=170367 RepID=UPI002782A28D|nr:hypothetical protein [Paenibacillus anaericanus]MDQ0087460.1 hypothetical protein [Paenibacillus anaericanus]
MESFELITLFRSFLYELDPPQGFISIGVNKASEWFRTLNNKQQVEIFEYVSTKFQIKGDTIEKEILIMFLQILGGDKSVKLLESIIEDGVEVHSVYLIQNSKNAIKKILSR